MYFPAAAWLYLHFSQKERKEHCRKKKLTETKKMASTLALLLGELNDWYTFIVFIKGPIVGIAPLWGSPNSGNLNNIQAEITATITRLTSGAISTDVGRAILRYCQILTTNTQWAPKEDWYELFEFWKSVGKPVSIP